MIAMSDNNEEKQPWDRQKNEQISTYSLFNEYLKLGPLRTISKLSTQVLDDPDFEDPPNKEALQKQATRWHWKARAEAYDDDRIARDRKELEARAHERLIKRLDQNELEEDKLHKAIIDTLNATTTGEFDKKGNPIPFKITAKAYAVDCFSKAKKNASDSQRLDYGEPTSISKDSLDLKKKEDKEVSEIKDLFAEAEKANDDDSDLEEVD